MKFPFYDSSNRTTSLSAEPKQMCGGIGLVVGREWENFMAIFIHGSFGGSQWDLFSGGKKVK